MVTLERYLQDIENRLLPEQEDRIIEQWRVFATGGWEEPVFSPARELSTNPSVEWPEININDALESDELMVLDQFSKVSKQLANGYGGLLTVRSNFGVGILPSLFGTEPFIMPREMNTLPNVRHLPGGETTMAEIALGGVPDFSNGWGASVFRVGRIYQDIRSRYPRIARYVQTDHPDCQGPMDVCELLWGSDIFYALYDSETLVHDLLRTVTDTYERFLDSWFELLPPANELHNYFGNGHLGKICVRDDSAMNLSPEMYESFIFPYNDEVLTWFGGGAIHSCGRVDHFVPSLRKMKDLHGFNLSQPEYNDMEKVYAHTVDAGIPIIGLRRETAEGAVRSSRALKGLVSVN